MELFPSSLLKICTQITDEICSLPISYDFLMPVDVTYLPDYNDIIKVPMDLGTIRDKLKNQEYKYFVDWEKDMLLVFDNAIKYNLKTPIGNIAEYLKKKVKKKISLIKILNHQNYEESLRFCYRQILETSKERFPDFPISVQKKCPRYNNQDLLNALNKYPDKNQIKKVIQDTGSSNALKKSETNIVIERLSRQTLDTLYIKYGTK